MRKVTTFVSRLWAAVSGGSCHDPCLHIQVSLDNTFVVQNKAYRAAKTVWQMEKELQSVRRRIDTWQAHVQRAEADLTFTRDNFAMHKVTGCLRHGKVVSGECEVCLCPMHMRLPGVYAQYEVTGMLCSPLSSISFTISCVAGFGTAHRLLEQLHCEYGSAIYIDKKQFPCRKVTGLLGC